MCKKFYSILLLLFCTYTVRAQQSGIQFEQNSTWSNILAKAKAEHKYIFVDCYATWCGPCKEMDKATYTDDRVGQFFKEHFVAVKLQMDNTAHDNSDVRSWYTIAKEFSVKYHIAGYPSFLFFSPDGFIIDKAEGLRYPDEFMEICKAALDSSKQFYPLAQLYRDRGLSYSRMPELTVRAQALGYDKLSDSVASDYLNNYLLKLPAKDLFTATTLAFIQKSAKVHSAGYNLLTEHASKIDSLLGKGVAKTAQIQIVVKKEVIPLTADKRNINWNLLEKELKSKYGDIGLFAVRQQRLYTDFMGQDWKDYPEAFMKYYKVIGIYNRLNINNMCWIVVANVSDKNVVKFAAGIMKAHYRDAENDIQSMDTYANLLYKSGDVRKAIQIEQEAAAIEANAAQKQNRQPDPVYKATLTKIKKGEKTW